MSNLRTVLALAAALPPGALFLYSCGNSAGEKTNSPNVIFILADDLGWAEAGCYGNSYNETPNLDRMAEEGILFTQAYAAAPVCSPYRAALMTGQYPARLGITDYLRPDDNKHLPDSLTTIAGLFRSKGYSTGIIGKWHLSGYAKNGVTEFGPAGYGFDETIMNENTGIAEGSYFHPYHFNTGIEKRLDGEEFLVDRMNLEAIDFIDRHKDGPFFLYLSHYAVHTRLSGRADDVAYFRAKPGAGSHPQNDEWAPDNNPHLAAQLKRIDEGLGMIMAKLEQEGLDMNTIVIFTSDNGGETRVTSNAPLRGGKSMLYEGGIREPLLIWYPARISGGRVCNEPCVNYDFLPTFCDILNQELPEGQVEDGCSLWPLLTDQEKVLQPRRLYWHYPLDAPHFLGGRSASAIRDGDWKLICFHDSGERELYNLTSDPGEVLNLAGKESRLADSLQHELYCWLRTCNAENIPVTPEISSAPCSEACGKECQEQAVPVRAARCR